MTLAHPMDTSAIPQDDVRLRSVGTPTITDSFLPDRPLPDHQLEIVDAKIIWESRIRGVGNFIRRLVTFNDGSRYEDQQAEPEKLQFEVGVTMTTPWCTRIPGLNTEYQKMLAMRGIASDLVGPPELPKGGLSLLRNIHSIAKLVKNSHDAAAQLTLARYAADRGIFGPDELMAAGYSRGGMILWDVLGYDKDFGFNVLFIDSNDPCLVIKPRPADIDVANPDTYLYPAREVLAFMHAIQNHSWKERKALLKTVIGNHHLLQHVAVGCALFEGQAGWHIGRIPKDKVGAVRLYDKSLGNQGDVLKTVLADFPHLHFIDRQGLHISGMNRRVQQASVGRITLAQTLHRQGQPLHTIDWSKVTPITEPVS